MAFEMWLSWIVNDRIYVIQLIKQFSHEKSFTYFIELKLRRLIDSREEEKKMKNSSKCDVL